MVSQFSTVYALQLAHKIYQQMQAELEQEKSVCSMFIIRKINCISIICQQEFMWLCGQ